MGPWLRNGVLTGVAWPFHPQPVASQARPVSGRPRAAGKSSVCFLAVLGLVPADPLISLVSLANPQAASEHTVSRLPVPGGDGTSPGVGKAPRRHPRPA